MGPDDLVTIATFPNSMEASVARGALEAAGIPAFVPDENRGVFARDFSTGPPKWAELKVRVSDRDRATEVLKEVGRLER